MSLFVENTILIHADQNLVWDMLTNPDKTPLYMFGCRAVSDWNVGSNLDWVAEVEGTKVTYVTGQIKSIDLGKKLCYTTFDPNQDRIPNIPENHVSVWYDLQEKENGTLLHVKQGDFETVAEGIKRYEEANNNGLGWMPLLEEIKRLCETLS